MEFGITLFTADRGISPVAAARTAEELGFSAFYVPEHTHIPVDREALHPTGGEELPDDRYRRTLDPWVALATAAAVTTKIRLGTAVALPVEHDPIALAKTIATADYVSGGRVTLGVGFGWNLDELRNHGVDTSRRRTMLRDYLDAMRALWTQEEAEFHSEFVNFDSAWAWPKPIQPAGPLVLVGAGCSEKNFRWIARHADGWMTTPIDTDIPQAVERLRAMWADCGREGSPRVVVLDGKPNPDTLEQYREIGVDEVVYGTPDRTATEVESYLERLAGKVGLR